MKIVVTIKQVYDPATVRVSRSRGILDTRAGELIMNPGDKYPLEEAMKLRDDTGAKVVALSLGPPEAEDILREALATGVDEAVLLTGEAFSGLDASAAVKIVGTAIEKLGGCDLIMTGVKATGDGTGEFAPRLAGFLSWPQVLRASDIQVTDIGLTAKRRLSSGYALLGTDLPVVVSVEGNANRPRYPSLPGSIAAYDERSVAVWGPDDLGLSPEDLAEAKRTEVRATAAGPEREKGRTISGDPADAAAELLGELRGRGLIPQ
jgi:electron transfer flavoprotein alpha/beta subunit